MYGAFFIGLDFVSVKKKIKKELGQYPAALKSPLVNNSHCTITSERCGQSWHQSRDQQITKAWFYSNPLCSVLLILILIIFLRCIFLLLFFFWHLLFRYCPSSVICTGRYCKKKREGIQNPTLTGRSSLPQKYFKRSSLHLVRLKIFEWINQGNWAGRNFVTKSRVISRLITHARMHTEMNLKSTTTTTTTTIYYLLSTTIY